MNVKSYESKHCGIFVEGLKKTTKANAASCVHGPLKGCVSNRPCMVILVY
jgi:hypothetical protein